MPGPEGERERERDLRLQPRAQSYSADILPLHPSFELLPLTSVGIGLSSCQKMASLGDDLLVTVNKLQDLVFNTIGNDSLDLPQIVSKWITTPNDF